MDDNARAGLDTMSPAHGSGEEDLLSDDGVTGEGQASGWGPIVKR